MKNLNNDDFLSYLAGFLDGDGCINVEIVPRSDYLLKFQIRFTITFFQKTSRHWFIIWLDKKIKLGVIRKRNDDISEYTITGPNNVKYFLLLLLPFLQIKKPQAKLVLEIINNQSKKQSKENFLKSCEMVDRISLMNDSKKKLSTSDTVRKIFNL